MPDTFPFKYEQADDSPGFVLWKLTSLWHAKLGGIFGELGINQTQYAILASLLWLARQHGLPVTQSYLVAHTNIDKMTLSKAIRKLESSGLVQRVQSKTDTRTIQVSLTSGGRKLVKQAVVAVERADDEFFSCLSQRQLASWRRQGLTIVERNKVVGAKVKCLG